MNLYITGPLQKISILFLLCFFTYVYEAEAQNAHNFGFYGYMRSGFGIDGYGGPQEAFRAPNTEAKYRLGNEAEAYIEALFKYSFKDDNGVLFESNLRLAFVTPTSKSNSFATTTSVREAYVLIKGIVKNKHDMSFWAGQRFYDRYDAHMNDFWYRDMSGFGGGFESLDLGGKAKLALAFLGGSIDQLQSNGNIQPENEFTLNKVTIDLSIYEIKIGFGHIGFTFDWSTFKGDSVVTDAGTYSIKTSNGLSASIFHEFSFQGGRNRLNLFYGVGAAENHKAIIQQPIGLSPEPSVAIEVKDMSRFRALNDLQIDISPKFSMLGLLIYQNLDNGLSENNKLNWYSVGLRPSYHFSRYFSLLAEIGLDYSSQLGATDGSLIKLTIAPQIAPLNKILSRPAIRAYFTYAIWSDSFIGQVAPLSYGDKNHGMSFGIQMESWW